MLNTNLHLLQAATQQEPHRAPAIDPRWNNGDGEFGHAREGEQTPATNSSAKLSGVEGMPRLNGFFMIIKQEIF